MDLYAFYLGSKNRVMELETFEIIHPSFSKVYRVIRNGTTVGMNLMLENGDSPYFTYYPVKIQRQAQDGSLDTPLQIAFGDLGMILPGEIDLVRANDTFMTKPTVVYRTFRSDDLSSPLEGPLIYQLNTTVHKFEAATLNVGPPSLNLSKTGEEYAFDRFSALRAL